MTWTTRYLGVITYGVLAAVLILKEGVITNVQEAGILLAPIAVFIAADQLKHRNDV